MWCWSQLSIYKSKGLIISFKASHVVKTCKTVLHRNFKCCIFKQFHKCFTNSTHLDKAISFAMSNFINRQLHQLYLTKCYKNLFKIKATDQQNLVKNKHIKNPKRSNNLIQTLDAGPRYMARCWKPVSAQLIKKSYLI